MADIEQILQEAWSTGVGRDSVTVSSQPVWQARGLARWRLPDLSQASTTVLLLLVALVSLYPIAQVVLQSFQSSSPGEAATWSLSGWQALVSERGLQTAVWNTINLTLVRQALALVVGIVVAWLLGRTNVPGRHIFEFLFWLAFFFPSLTVTLSWVFLLDPRFGVFNQLLASTGSDVGAGHRSAQHLFVLGHCLGAPGRQLAGPQGDAADSGLPQHELDL